MKQATTVFAVLSAAILSLSLNSCEFKVSTAKIKEAKLTKDDAGTQASTVFGPKDTIYLKVDLVNAPASTVTAAHWIAVDVDADVPKNHPVQNFDIEHGSGMLTFNLSTDKQWPKGKYRVDVSLNGETKLSREYTVEE